MPTRQQTKKMSQKTDAVKEQGPEDFDDEDLAGVLDDDAHSNTKNEHSGTFNQKCMSLNIGKSGKESVYSDEQVQS